MSRRIVRLFRAESPRKFAHRDIARLSQRPLPPGASWWSRSSRSYADWKGSWAPVMIPIGIVVAVVGLVVGLAGR